MQTLHIKAPDPTGLTEALPFIKYSVQLEQLNPKQTAWANVVISETSVSKSRVEAKFVSGATRGWMVSTLHSCLQALTVFTSTVHPCLWEGHLAIIKASHQKQTTPAPQGITVCWCLSPGTAVVSWVNMSERKRWSWGGLVFAIASLKHQYTIHNVHALKCMERFSFTLQTQPSWPEITHQMLHLFLKSRPRETSADQL